MNLKPEELVKALRCTATPGGPTGDCEMCPYYRRENLNDELKEKLGTDTWTSCDIDKVGMDAAELIERLEKEKAALINTIRGFCRHCKNVDVDENCGRAWVGCSICSKDCPCAGCRKGSKWEWKGVDEE